MDCTGAISVIPLTIFIIIIIFFNFTNYVQCYQKYKLGVPTETLAQYKLKYQNHFKKSQQKRDRKNSQNEAVWSPRKQNSTIWYLFNESIFPTLLILNKKLAREHVQLKVLDKYSSNLRCMDIVTTDTTLQKKFPYFLDSNNETSQYGNQYKTSR